jgi:ABC-type multidrug transport system ATPase subunit
MKRPLQGPSGSGKTTLLDVISRRKKSSATSGQLLYDGIPPTLRLIKKETAYVQQNVRHKILLVRQLLLLLLLLLLPLLLPLATMIIIVIIIYYN